MKEGLPAYHAAVVMIKPLGDREGAEGNDTFDVEAWWKRRRGDYKKAVVMAQMALAGAN